MGADATFTPGQLRALMIAVVVMGFILIFGFVGLLVALAYRSSSQKAKGIEPQLLRTGQRPPVSLAEIRALYAGAAPAVRLIEGKLPPGARIVAATVAGGSLAVVAEDGGGASVLLVDLASGRLTSVTRLQSD